MKRLIAALIAALLAGASVNALACQGDKAKDGTGGMSTPSKPSKPST
jgi:hypothetical protein